MARNYTQVLEDVVKNQSVQIAQLVCTNEELSEKLIQQNDIINRYLSNSGSSPSGGQFINPNQEIKSTPHEAGK